MLGGGPASIKIFNLIFWAENFRKKGFLVVFSRGKGVLCGISEQRGGEGLGGGYYSNQRLEQSHDRVGPGPWWTNVSLKQTFLAIVLKGKDIYTLFGIYTPWCYYSRGKW